jgi:hypothetical protein
MRAISTQSPPNQKRSIPQVKPFRHGHRVRIYLFGSLISVPLTLNPALSTNEKGRSGRRPILGTRGICTQCAPLLPLFRTDTAALNYEAATSPLGFSSNCPEHRIRFKPSPTLRERTLFLTSEHNRQRAGQPWSYRCYRDRYGYGQPRVV